MDGLEQQYAEMARDAESERDALEWSEAIIGDIADMDDGSPEPADGPDAPPQP